LGQDQCRVIYSPPVRKLPLCKACFDDWRRIVFFRNNSSAQPFFTAVLAQNFSRRSIVVVTNGLKTQESFQQDIETWIKV
jgi:hypothetical protein